MVHANLESALPRSLRSMIPIVTVVLAAAVMLSACGRKGPLDPPPGGMVIEQRPGLTPTTRRSAEDLPAYDEQGRPVAPTGPKRRIPPDWLID
jgi:predicted small lipoprotein YifL